jgi:hypothetical protein
MAGTGKHRALMAGVGVTPLDSSLIFNTAHQAKERATKVALSNIFITTRSCENSRRMHQIRTGKCAVVKSKGCTVLSTFVVDLKKFM